MIFGFELTLTHIAYGGILTFSLLVFQMLVGMRIIKFKGRTHMKVHRRGAWALVVIAVGHGFAAMTLYNGWSIFS